MKFTYSNLFTVVKVAQHDSTALFSDLEFSVFLSLGVVSSNQQIAVSGDLENLSVWLTASPVTESNPFLADGDSTAIAVSLGVPFSLVNETCSLDQFPLSELAIGVLVVLRCRRESELFDKVYSLISV